MNDVFHRVYFLGLLLFAQLFDAVEPSSVVGTIPFCIKKIDAAIKHPSRAAYSLACLTGYMGVPPYFWPTLRFALKKRPKQEKFFPAAKKCTR